MSSARVGWGVAGLAIGLVVGLNLAGLWPQIPVHAVSTHGEETFGMCTAPVDSMNEAVIILDYVTGDMMGWAINVQRKPQFLAAFKYNVSKDLAGSVKNPKYLMVSGLVDNRQGATAAGKLGNAAIYVAEINSGQMAAYAIPWQPQRHSAGQPQAGAFIPLDRVKFRDVAAPAGTE
jgi:hypothetical protein